MTKKAKCNHCARAAEAGQDFCLRCQRIHACVTRANQRIHVGLCKQCGLSRAEAPRHICAAAACATAICPGCLREFKSRMHEVICAACGNAAAAQKRRRRLMEAGICFRCGKNEPAAGQKDCRDCRAQSALYMLAMRRKITTTKAL